MKDETGIEDMSAKDHEEELSMKNEQQDLHKGKILVVDDEEEVSRLLQKLLDGEGYNVRYALNFDEVRRAFEQEPFDLVTLDIIMPEVDGLQVLKWIKENFPDTGVVMATALGELDVVLEAMRSGATNYLLKPFNFGLVIEEIGRAMERQRLIAENRSYQLELEQKVEERTRELNQAYVQLERQMRELEGRDRMVRFQMSVHTLEEAYAKVLEELKQVLGVQRAILYRADDKGGWLEGVAAIGLSVPGCMEKPYQLTDLPLLLLGDTSNLSVQAFREKKTIEGTEDEMAVPVLYHEEILGVLWLCSPQEKTMPKEEILNTLWRLGSEAALVLRGALMAEELESGVFSFDELEGIE